MLLDSRNAPISKDENNSRHSKDAQDSGFDPTDLSLGSYTFSSDPTATLLVSKLPAILFSQTHDLEPLFYPYGPLKKLEVVGRGLSGTLSVLAQYHSTSAAQEAREALHGQNYINCQVEVHFLRPATSPLDPLQPSRVLSPFEAGTTPEIRIQSAVDISGTGSRYESHGSSRSLGKRVFHAPPNFSSACNNRDGSRFSSASSRWVTSVYDACGR